jgi:mannose-6-phosphate isomerase-like protein (cupin superfamily)
MICQRIEEGEQFWCAGNLYTMLIPRDATQSFEAVLETIEPGITTPPNAHENFAQMYFIVSGKARVWIGEESKETSGPAVAFIPQNTNHYVKNIGDAPLKYIYVSIWPGTIPESDGREWRSSVKAMVKMYASRGYPAQRKGVTPVEPQT